MTIIGTAPVQFLPSRYVSNILMGCCLRSGAQSVRLLIAGMLNRHSMPLFSMGRSGTRKLPRRSPSIRTTQTGKDECWTAEGLGWPEVRRLVGKVEDVAAEIRQTDYLRSDKQKRGGAARTALCASGFIRLAGSRKGEVEFLKGFPPLTIFSDDPNSLAAKLVRRNLPNEMPGLFVNHHPWWRRFQ